MSRLKKIRIPHEICLCFECGKPPIFYVATGLAANIYLFYGHVDCSNSIPADAESLENLFKGCIENWNNLQDEKVKEALTKLNRIFKRMGVDEDEN